MFYVSTAGGCYVPDIYGFGYVKELAVNFYGIPEVKQFIASGLDIKGADPDEILKAAEASIDNMSYSSLT
jgi:FMN-dependent NADH-azoreductase